VALSDPDGILASPLTILERRDESSILESLVDLIKQYEVGRVIVGLPVSLNGSLGSQAVSIRDFTEKLRGIIDVPLEYRDESLTSVIAGRLLRETRKGRKRQKVRDDAAAAALILQSYLDERVAPKPWE
jgi:putative Holliday junction resolvase